jgi:hypothetical protein
MSFDKMLVVGFDGLDYEKIREYGCESLVQESFGKLETEGIKLSTPPLWASMITGEKPEVHGIDTMLEFRGEKVRKVDRYVLGFLKKLGLSAMHLRRALYYYLFDSSQFVIDKEFMQVDSIFEKVADSKPLDVPGYSEYPYIAGKSYVGKALRKRPPVSKERVERDMEAEHMYRKNQLFEHIGKHSLVMQHFHYPDWFQHLFFKGDRDKELYHKMDEVAGEILERVDDETLVVFCSDHGLEDGGHRDQAFYSVNNNIGEEVKITNLLSRCLDKIEYSEREEVTAEVSV